MNITSMWLTHNDKWQLTITYTGTEGGDGELTIEEFLEAYPWHRDEVKELLLEFAKAKIEKDLI